MKKNNFKTYLIFGGAGFIGSHFCDYILNNGDKVICVDNLSLGSIENITHLLEKSDFEFYELDINNLTSDDFPDIEISTVVHLAANSDIAKSHIDPNIDISNTLNTTLNILAFMRDRSIKEIIFASSSAIYGQHDGLIHEDIGPLLPHSHYGAAKLASEAFISSYCENYGLKSWIIRFPNVIGERCTHGVIYDFFEKLKMDKTILHVLGNGKQNKPYIYVHELIEGIMHCYKTFTSKINYVNLGTDSSTTVDEIIKIFKEVYEIDPEIKYSGGVKGWVGDIPKFSYDLSKIHLNGWKAKLSSTEAVFKTLIALKKSWM